VANRSAKLAGDGETAPDEDGPTWLPLTGCSSLILAEDSIFG